LLPIVDLRLPVVVFVHRVYGFLSNWI
jgi:hypothetical protein